MRVRSVLAPNTAIDPVEIWRYNCRIVQQRKRRSAAALFQLEPFGASFEASGRFGAAVVVIDRDFHQGGTGHARAQQITIFRQTLLGNPLQCKLPAFLRAVKQI